LWSKPSELIELRRTLTQLNDAVTQVARSGNLEQVQVCNLLVQVKRFQACRASKGGCDVRRNCLTCGAVCHSSQAAEGLPKLSFENTEAQKKIEQLKNALHHSETLHTERATKKQRSI